MCEYKTKIILRPVGRWEWEAQILSGSGGARYVRRFGQKRAEKAGRRELKRWRAETKRMSQRIVLEDV